MVIVAAMAVMLTGATVLATEDALAGKEYRKNQATSQTNACGNDKLPLNVLCSNTGSQVQGEENAVALDSFQEAGEAHEDKKNGDHDKKNGGHDEDFDLGLMS